MPQQAQVVLQLIVRDTVNKGSHPMEIFLLRLLHLLLFHPHLGLFVEQGINLKEAIKKVLHEEKVEL